MIRYSILALMLGISNPVFASESVQFTNKELGAVFTLMRPELNALELQGRRANYTPSPSMKYLGVEAESIPLDLTVIADIVDLEFNHIKAKTPEVKFQDGSLQLILPVEDQSKAVRSMLGSISFKGVTLTAELGWNARSNGIQDLVVKRTVFKGTLSGTGVLRSSFILNKTRDLCLSELTKAIKKFLAGEKVQSSIAGGLMEYGRFFSGKEIKEIIPGSIQFNQEGIRYDVN